VPIRTRAVAREHRSERHASSKETWAPGSPCAGVSASSAGTFANKGQHFDKHSVGPVASFDEEVRAVLQCKEASAILRRPITALRSTVPGRPDNWHT